MEKTISTPVVSVRADTISGLLEDFKAFLEGTDSHEQIMDAFNQRYLELFEANQKWRHNSAESN